MDLRPGTVLLGKYRIDEVIGSGGMGKVVRASHMYLQQAVAIKVLVATDGSATQRFLREAQATVKLKSEHIARVMDVATLSDGTPVMVMEYLDGSDLNQILRRHGPQPAAVVVDLMLQACEGIAEAHALRIVHRDLKPSNFFLTKRPDGTNLLKILDFGISKAPIVPHDATATQTVLGTPSYMAPEQMKSGKGAEARSDLWSMGVVMYQLVSGRPPFVGESYADLVLKVAHDPPAPLLVPLPPGLGEVILRCLEKDPRQRHADVAELARMLAPFATDPIGAAQSATRTLRTLQQRISGSIARVQGSGPRAAPLPLHPDPPSWPPSSAPSSPSLAAAAIALATPPPRPNRGFLVASVASLCILAGTGGYIASELRHRGGAAAGAATAPATTVVAPVSSAPPAAPTVTWKPTIPTPTITAQPTVIAPPKALPPPAAPPPAPSTSPPASTALPADAPPAKKPAPRNTDLFDSRH